MRDDPTAGTVVRVTQISAVGVCPRCGARLFAVGSDPVLYGESVADLHDLECDDLAKARRLLAPVPDSLDDLAEAERAITAGYLAGLAAIKGCAA